MNERNLFRFNTALIVVAIIAVITSVILETLSGKDFIGIGFNDCVWIHVITCSVCMAMIVYHLYIHFGEWLNWFKKISTLNSRSTKILTWLTLITLATGVAAAIKFGIDPSHNVIGIIHGKFGIIVILFMILHLKRRIKWYKGRTKGSSFIPEVDQEKCVKCGLCVKRCPAGVFVKENGKVIARNALMCHQCMKCVSKCKKQAIVGNTQTCSTKEKMCVAE